MRRFLLIALSSVGAIERKVKHTVMNNMLLFEKFPEVMVNQMGDLIRKAIISAATLACDSH
jgi:hypothetical protein